MCTCMSRLSSKYPHGRLVPNQVFSSELADEVFNSNLSSGLQGGRAFFSAVREGDLVVFASNDDQDRSLWVQAMYRATGQSYKPVPPALNQQNCRGGNTQKDAPISLLSRFCLCLFLNNSVLFSSNL